MCYIAYFDILGYKDFFSIQGNDRSVLLNSIKSIVNDLALSSSLSGQEEQLVHYKFFSDNCIVIIESDTQNEQYLRKLMTWMAMFQLKCLRTYKLLLRGGITWGPVYMDGDIVFGNGLIQAVTLESKKAIFPRIVCDSECSIDYTPFLNDGLVAKDVDDQLYVDCFSFLQSNDGYNPIPGNVSVGNSIGALARQNGKFPTNVKKEDRIAYYSSVIRKHIWVLEKFNAACDKKGIDEKERIAYTVAVNQKLYLCEIIMPPIKLKLRIAPASETTQHQEAEV